jgi:hypothetical protein
MTNAQRDLLSNLRRELIHLHKTLLDWERASYERRQGRTPAGEFLRVVMADPQFAWLRPVSDLIARIDEAIQTEAPDVRTDVASLVGQARTLVAPDEAGSSYAQKYHTALQQHPDAVLAHRAVTRILQEAPEPRERLH